MEDVTKRIVCIGGGHCNCQVLKLLKKLIDNHEEGQPKIALTLISDGDKSFYSGMLPGSVSQLYEPKDITVELAPLAKWCKAEYIDARVEKIEASANKVHCANGKVVEYDALAVNVGSKTKDTGNIKGVWENALTTRPINDLLGKIEKKEQDLKAKGVVPVVAVCGGGAAGTELSFAFKVRWSKYFG